MISSSGQSCTNAAGPPKKEPKMANSARLMKTSKTPLLARLPLLSNKPDRMSPTPTKPGMNVQA